MDTISSLSDEILCHVLNFLPIKEAALTCILSKRWRNLFAFTPDLDLCFVDDSENTPKCNKSFICFVDRVLALSGNFTIRKFSLKIEERVRSCTSVHVNRWIINVLNRGILELVLDTFINGKLRLPLDIFYSETLVRLKLGRVITISMVPENASLPALKTLFLDVVRFSGNCSFEALISVCPVLEELTVLDNHWYGARTVSSPTLKRLVFKCRSSPITFDTPSLAYLEYCDCVAEYPIVNLNSLVEANIDMQIISIKSNPTNLIKGLRNVMILKFSSVETSEVLYLFGEAIPVFENLSLLSITTKVGHCWRLMPLLIKNAPNLETLVINGPFHYSDEYVKDSGSICECLSEYSFLSTCPVKVLEITEYMGTKEELEHMKQFMKKLTCLELIIVNGFMHHRSTKASHSLQDPFQSFFLMH